MDFEWTYEAVETLKSKWAEGLTTAVIAEHLGVTRNAIAGKINRLGLPRRKLAEHLPRKLRKLRKEKAKPWQLARKPKEYIKRPSGLEVSFMELGWAMCRYIPGNPNDILTMYCGDPVLGVESYCPHHYKLCHMKTQRLIPSGALLGAVAGDPPSVAGGGSDLL